MDLAQDRLADHGLLRAPLAGTEVEKVDVRLRDGARVVGEWVRGARVTTTDECVYFLHGSGFALCSPRTHRRFTAWLSRLTGRPVFCVDYRLAPRHLFPTAAVDVGGGRRMPPTLVQAGGGEMLVGEARSLAADITAAGGDCELQVWPGQVHVFQALPRLAPDAVPAMQRVAAFIEESLRDNRIKQVAT